MFLIVRDEVFERETVVASNKVDARVRPTAAPFVEVARSGEPRRELGNDSSVSLPHLAHAIAILPVPFAPKGRKVADLIASFPQVPRLRDQLHL